MKPNIIFIFADDMGYGDISCQNPESKILTPNLDKLASEGMRFTEAHASSAVCTPSRYGVLTGRYAWRGGLESGVLWGYSCRLIEEDRQTVASLLKTEGYSTGCVGKWHLGWDWQLKPGAEYSTDRHGLLGAAPDDVDYAKPILNGPLSLGFDYFFGISASLDMDPYCYIENDKVTALPNRTIEASPYDAYWREGHISPDFIHEEVLPTFSDKADSFIREKANDDMPFFLYFPLNAPHTPILPAPEFQGRSGAGAYGDFVIQCDAVVGGIMKTLDELNIADNTLLIYTSDNGAERIAYQRALDTGHFSSGPLRGLKRDIWEGGHRIPFIARWPGQVSAGGVCDQTICLTDFFATVAEIAEASPEPDTGEDSLSLFNALKGDPIEHASR
ncbi:MAG: arylsulfatase, partial [Spirochaetales bacterium]|nr:arylsulfatase [Spirochaetales bacterium]